jgi:hypothetical protein
MLSSMDASFKSSRIPVKQANQIVRDICEMSISLDASTNKVDWNEMSLNRSQNPFTSSMNMGGSFGGYGGQQQNGNSQYQPQQNNNNNNSNYHGHSSSTHHHNSNQQQAYDHHNYPQQHHPSQQQQQHSHQQPQYGRNQPQQHHHQQQTQQHHQHQHRHHPESNRVGRPLQPARKRSESDDEYDNDFEAEEQEDSKTAHDNYYSRGGVGGEGKSSYGDNKYRK